MEGRPFLPDPGMLSRVFVPRASRIRLGFVLLCDVWSLKHFSSTALSVPPAPQAGSHPKGSKLLSIPEGNQRQTPAPLCSYLTPLSLTQLRSSWGYS